MSNRVLHWCLAAAVFTTACSDKELPDFRDKRGPIVVSVSPVDGATDVPVDADIVVQFDEAILFRKNLSGGRIEEFDYGGFVVANEAGEAIPGFLQFNNDTITFRATEPFDYRTKYTVTVNERIKDLFGNRALPFAWSFETEHDTIAPFPPYSLSYEPLTNTSPVMLYGAKEPDSALYINGNDAGVARNATNFEVSLALEEGPNTFQLTARDEAGNESTPVSITIQLDTLPPSPLTTCDGTGLLWHFEGRETCWNPPNPLVWNNFRLPIGARWPNPETDAVAVLQLGNEYMPFSSSVFSHDGFNPRKHTSMVKLRAFTRDNAGNESDVVFERDFIFDDIPPDLSLVEPNAMFDPIGLAETWTTLTETPLTFEKEADALFGATLNGSLVATCAIGETRCEVDLQTLTEGTHVFAASATDAAGNVSRIEKQIHVDTTPPVVTKLPLEGASTSLQPVLHVFADEPIVAPPLVLDDGITQVEAVLDEASHGRHWSYVLPAAEDGTFSVTVEDRAGNSTVVNWNFVADNNYVAPDSNYASVVTSGVRDGSVTLTATPAPLRVVRWDDGGSAGFAFTTSTSLTFTANPLTKFDGVLETYDDNGDYMITALPSNLWSTTPSLLADYAGHEAPEYLSLYHDVAAQGFTVLSQVGWAYRVVPGGTNTNRYYTDCSPGASRPSFPLAAVEAPFVVAGKPCNGFGANPGVSVLDLSAAGIATASKYPLWNQPAEANFGASIAAGEFFANGKLQFAVGSPDTHGKVYLYDSTADTAPKFKLKGDPLNTNGKFGESVAFAANHNRGKPVLAVVAAGEPAVYFFDNDLAVSAEQPLPKYWQRVALEKKTECLQENGRHEVLNAGDMDGDGGDDFAVASWWEACSLADPVYHLQLRFFFAGKEGAAVTFEATYDKLGTERPRLVALGDLNNDGLADVGHIDRRDGGLLKVYYGSASGNPGVRTLAPISASASDRWVLAGALDLNGDGFTQPILSKWNSGLLELMALP